MQAQWRCYFHNLPRRIRTRRSRERRNIAGYPAIDESGGAKRAARPTQQQELTPLPPQLQELIISCRRRNPNSRPDWRLTPVKFTCHCVDAAARLNTASSPETELTRVTARPQVERKTEKVPAANRLLRVRCCRLRRRSWSASSGDCRQTRHAFDGRTGRKTTTLLKDQIHFQLNKQQQISTSVSIHRRLASSRSPYNSTTQTDGAHRREPK